jgi:hypothetical protein
MVEIKDIAWVLAGEYNREEGRKKQESAGPAPISHLCKGRDKDDYRNSEDSTPENGLLIAIL